MTGAGAGARRLSSWHRFVVGIAVSAVIVGTTAVGANAAAMAIRACRGIIAAAVSRGSEEGGSRGSGGGYRGDNDVSVWGRLVSNAVTHPMVVLATVIADPFEIDGALQILATGRFRPHRSQWGPSEGGDSSWGHPPALVPPSNGPPRPKFAVSGFGGGRGCCCCCWRLT